MSSVQRIVLASGNAGKLRELAAMLEGTHLQVSSLRDYQPIAEPEEPYDTFEGNARHKARYYHQMLGLDSASAVLADDSGLCVDALGGAPGVYSAHYAGEPRSDERNNAYLLEQMAGFPRSEQRAAHFVCVLAIVGAGIDRTYRGEVHGHLARALSGSRGFGYDVLFVPRGYSQTFGELQDSVKRQISHRSVALQAMLRDVAAW